MDSNFWNHYLTGIYKFSRISSKEVAFRLRARKLTGKILDPGGGHGLYTAEILKANKNISGLIIDLPKACIIGREIVKREGVSDRVAFLEGDMRRVSWGSGYELILLFNIIHIFTVEENLLLLKKAYNSPKKGGKLAILDSQFHGGDNVSTEAGFNQLIFYILNGSSIFEEKRIVNWVKKTGFKNIRCTRLFSIPMSFFLVARK